MSNPDLHNWDTVFAISVPRVNDALSTVKASPNFDIEGPLGPSSLALAWSFGNWRIEEVSGKNIVVALDFLEGSTLTVTSADGEAETIDLTTTLMSGWDCKVTITPFWTDGDVRHLVANTEAGVNWATVEARGMSEDTDFTLDAALGQLIQLWFNTTQEAIALFQQEFATVDIGADYGDKGAPWLKPRELGYAGAEMADGVTQAIGLLAMTVKESSPDKERSAAAGDLMLSNLAIPSNAEAAFLISPELFMDNIGLPGSAAALSDDVEGRPDAFEYTDNSYRTIQNTEELSFAIEIQGKDQTATIAPRDFEASLEGRNFVLKFKKMSITTDEIGYDLSVKKTEYLVINLTDLAVPTDNGQEMRKVFATSTERVEDAETSYDPKLEMIIGTAILEILLTAVTVALAVKGPKGPLKEVFGLTDSGAKWASRGIAAIAGLAALAVGGAAGLHGAILAGKSEDLPDFGDALTQALSNRVSLPGNDSTNFHAKSAELADCLRIIVEPEFL